MPPGRTCSSAAATASMAMMPARICSRSRSNEDTGRFTGASVRIAWSTSGPAPSIAISETMNSGRSCTSRLISDRRSTNISRRVSSENQRPTARVAAKAGKPTRRSARNTGVSHSRCIRYCMRLGAGSRRTEPARRRGAEGASRGCGGGAASGICGAGAAGLWRCIRGATGAHASGSCWAGST